MVGPFAASAGSDVVAWRPGVETRLHAGASRGATALCVMEQWCAPGTGAPRHTHFDVEEVIVVVAGVAEFDVDGATERVEAGGAIVLPAHSLHGFTNVGEATLHTVAAFSSARPTVAYESDPDAVLEIGGTGPDMLDAHRAYKDV